MTELCFHCDQPINEKPIISIEWKDKTRFFCCYGCQSVAQAIIDNNLDDYYQFRTQVSLKPENLIPQELRDLQLIDDNTIQQSFVTKRNNLCTAELAVEGITCAACSWLIERRLLKEPGVLMVAVNPITHRIKLKWDQNQQQLSNLLTQLKQLGFKSYPFQNNHDEKALSQENKQYLIRLGISGLGMMQVMMFAVGLYLGDDLNMEPAHQRFLHWVSGLVATPIVFYAAFPFFRNAWFGLKSLRLVMDVPVVIAIATAYIASVWATIAEQGNVYFDSVSMFIFFLLLGRYLEHRVRLKSVRTSQTQRQTLPLSVTRAIHFPHSNVDQFEDIPLHQVQPDDVILVKEGETIPVDGIILQGTSHLDESFLTGESHPQTRVTGERVLAGTINMDQPLKLSITAKGEDTYFSALQRMAMETLSAKPKFSQLADTIAHWFVAGILMIVTAVYLTWLSLDPDRAFWIALSVLVVSCPCALSLATPAALTAASQKLARIGFLILKPNTLQSLATITVAAFDKTGTLTKGQLSLHKVDNFIEHDTQLLTEILASMEQSSHHPIARALCSLTDKRHPIQNLQHFSGQGVEATYRGHRYRFGKASFVDKRLTEKTPHLEINPSICSVSAYCSCDGQLIAEYLFTDQIKSDAAQLMDRLKRKHFRTLLISGDHSNAVFSVARQLTIDRVYANQLPEQKLALIQAQQAEHKVLMVGDGLNDALVLAQANVGIAINTATDLTQSKADAVLTSPNLTTIADALDIASKSHKIIKQNLAWALIYNILAIPFAAIGWIPPWLAAIGMTLSSLLVVLNALRLSR